MTNKLLEMRNVIRNLFWVGLLLLVACQQENNQTDAYGNFEAEEIVLSSEIQGPVKLFEAEEGSRLKKGDSVVLVDTVLPSIDLARALAGRRAAEAGMSELKKGIDVQKTRLDVLHREVVRITNLHEENAVSTRKYDQVTGDYEIAAEEMEHLKSRTEALKEQIKLATQKVRTAREKLNRCIVKAPENGVLLQKYVEKGELATPGKPLFKMAETRELILRAYISGDQLDEIRVGQKVTVKYDRNREQEHSAPGTVTWISPSAEFTPKIIQTKEERVDLVYAIKVKVSNPKGEIKIGMPGEVVF